MDTTLPNGLILTSFLDPRFKKQDVADFFFATSRMLAGSGAPPVPEYPYGILVTEIVGSYFEQAAVAQAFIGLHEAVGTKAAALEYHYPPTNPGWHYQLMPDTPAVVSDAWWNGLVPPFKAYAQPKMEKRIVCFSTELTAVVKEFRRFDYAMDVSQISSNGLRFKVSSYDGATGTPELWALAYQTQVYPSYIDHGVQGSGFTVENPTLKAGEQLWFKFTAANVSAADIELGILAPRTETGECAQSFTNYNLKRGQMLNWRDKMTFTQPGVYRLYLGIGFDAAGCVAMTAPWYRLSDSVLVTVTP